MDRRKYCKLAIILNGPPGCGKDTIAEEFVKRGFGHYMMKEQLYVATADYFGIYVSEFKKLATDRSRKEIADPLFRDRKHPTKPGEMLSPREAMIFVSENIFKPVYGNSYFGHMAAEACKRDRVQLAVFSDGGFSEEVIPILRCFEDVLIVHLYRQGFTFKNDSRDYIYGFEHTQGLTLLDGEIDLAVTQIFNMLLDEFGGCS